MKNPSKLLKFDRFRWSTIPLREYKTAGDDFREITRQTLLGDGEGEHPLRSISRYFEIAPGGYSSLERHEHPHSVIVIRGSGRVLLDREVHAVAPFDCVYVAPGTAHQFQAAGDEPLGFLCIVDRERDRPTPLSREQVGNDAALP